MSGCRRRRATVQRAGTRPWVLFALATLSAGACGDDAVGPAEVTPPEFPTLQAAVATEFCVRGSLIPGESVTGEVIATNCPTVEPVGIGPGRFFETWRVRVGQGASVTLELTSDFDTVLNLFRIDDLAEPVIARATLVAFSDDDGVDANARLTITLQAGTEYWATVSGFNPDDVGVYSLDAR